MAIPTPASLTWRRAGYLHPDAPLRVGRHQRDADLRLESLAVSNRHCTISVRGGCCYVEDQGSSHGTFLNGTRLDRPTRLQPGDTVQLGRVAPVLLRVEPVISSTSGPAAAAPSLRDLTSWHVLIATPPAVRTARRASVAAASTSSAAASSSCSSTAPSRVVTNRHDRPRRADLFARLDDNADVLRLILGLLPLPALRCCRCAERRLRALAIEVMRGPWRTLAPNAHALRHAMWREGSYDVGGAPAHAAAVTSLALAGRLLGSASADGTAKLWSVPQKGANLSCARVLSHPRAVVAIALQPAAGGWPLVATACADGVLRLWKGRSGALQWERGRRGLGPVGGTTSLAWAAPDALIGGTVSGSVWRLDVTGGGGVGVAVGGNGQPSSSTPLLQQPHRSGGAAAEAAAEAAAACSDGLPQIVSSGRVHQGSVGALAASACGVALSGGADGCIWVWRVGGERAADTDGAPSDGGEGGEKGEEGEKGAAPPPRCVLRRHGHSAPVTAVALSPAAASPPWPWPSPSPSPSPAGGVARRGVSCAADGTIRLWELPAGGCVATLVAAGAPGRLVVALSHASLLSAGDGAPLVHLWDADGGGAADGAGGGSSGGGGGGGGSSSSGGGGGGSSGGSGGPRPIARLAGHAASVCALALEQGCLVSADTAGRLRVRRQPF